MQKKLLLFFFAINIFLFGSSQSKNYFQQQANYAIEVSLNDADNTLQGFEKIEYINNSPDTLRYVLFHLWPNAYKNDRAAFSEQLLYDAGIQLSLIHCLVNIYAPIIYSKVYSDYFKSTLGDNRFWKTISFNINLDVIKLNNLSNKIPL